jgi:uncharacterized membrane protein YkvA (DUF1232 family)
MPITNASTQPEIDAVIADAAAVVRDLLAIGQHPEASSASLQLLLNHGNTDVNVFVAVASNAQNNVSAAVLNALLALGNADDVNVLTAVARNENADADALNALLALGAANDVNVLTAVAQHENADADALNALLALGNADDVNVLTAVARNENADADALNALLVLGNADDVNVLTAVARNENADNVALNALLALGNADDVNVLTAVARNENADNVALNALLALPAANNPHVFAAAEGHNNIDAAGLGLIVLARQEAARLEAERVRLLSPVMYFHEYLMSDVDDRSLAEVVDQAPANIQTAVVQEAARIAVAERVHSNDLNATSRTLSAPHQVAFVNAVVRNRNRK